MAIKIGRAQEVKADNFDDESMEVTSEIKHFNYDESPHHIEDISTFLRKIFGINGEKDFEGMSKEYIESLDSNTAPNQDGFKEAGDYKNYSSDELEQVWNNDPQYLNEHVYRTLPSIHLGNLKDGEISRQEVNECLTMDNYDEFEHSEHGNTSVNSNNDEMEGRSMSSLDEERIDSNSFYISDGLHNDHVYNDYIDGKEITVVSKGVIDWRKDAVDGTEQKISLPEGKILKRYGDENGYYLTDSYSKFENLNLPSEHSLKKVHNYIVSKPFIVLKSTIADQPFSIRDKSAPQCSQYKVSMKVVDLVRLGFLTPITNKEKI